MLDVKILTDLQLLNLIKADHEPAFKELYCRYWKQLYAFAYNRVRSREVAEEIVQDFLTNFWLNRAKLNIQSSFEGYIYTSIKNLVLNYFAREARKSQMLENISVSSSVLDNSTEELIMLHELRLVITREVSQLPVKCRSVFELSRIENKSNKEIAQTLGISEKTVEGHLSKALKRLRLNLNALVVTVFAIFIY
ncbi:RNA polymerase sigma-70 factor [Mucilaginibacter sp. CSA2-8R]|uniref:RNA polymerase sigma-70 factor n=1 Tax=Mucilaginibacter sp. CSA2-8R TaxID=3141542 RepID=UPI00315D8A11